MSDFEFYAADDIVLLMSNLGSSEENFIKNKDEAYKLGFCGFMDNELVRKTSINNSEQYRLTEEALDKLYFFYKKGFLLNDINLNSIPDVIVCPTGFNIKPEILEFLSQDDVPISFVRVSESITSNYTLNPNDPNYLRNIEEMAYYNRLAKNKIIAKNRASDIEKDAERKFGNDDEKKQQYIIGQVKEMYKMKDQVTYNHICGMIDLIPVIQAGLPDGEKLTEDEYRELYSMIVLHDLGKLTVPNQILNKPGMLSASEKDKMHSHVLMENANIINNACLQELLKRALTHHKKSNLNDARINSDLMYTQRDESVIGKTLGMDDGTVGYWDSDALGNPVHGKLESILQILDSYNALTATDRPYKETFSPSEALEILMKPNTREPLDYSEKYLKCFTNGLINSGMVDKSSLNFDGSVIEDGGKRL